MLFGHEDKVREFKKVIETGRLGHAYLFFGDAQIGKFSFAKSLGHFLEFGNFAAQMKFGRVSPNFSKVGRELSDEPLFDTKIFTPNEKGVIGVDAVRSLKSFLWQTPFWSSKKLAIIDEARALTTEAQSALLKIVEEPPAHGLLIFIAPNTQVFFPPLLSRLNKIYFRRLPAEKLEKVLIEHFEVPPAKAKIIAQNSFGRIGLALAILNGGLKTGETEDSLEKDLENKILALRKQGTLKNASLIAWLLERETSLKRFNLNKNLQKKAIQNRIYSYESPT